MTNVVLAAQDLRKVYRKPFSGARVEAVGGVSFDVKRGEIFGFLGPNGAGKTTTIKMLMGLVKSSGGSMTLLGRTPPDKSVMGRVGFLPENPYVYPYLTPREFVALCARLSGVGSAELQTRVTDVLARVGIAPAMDRPARSLSKGMLQRVGLAAALVHDPELLVLDEPMSGLDPVGRKEVRDLIVEERVRGRTVFFSSHILSDVELLCDRVCILRKGRVVVSGSLRDLLSRGKRHSEITIAGASDSLRASLAAMDQVKSSAVGDLLVLDVEGQSALRAVIEQAFASGARLESVAEKRETLEELFVREAVQEQASATLA